MRQRFVTAENKQWWTLGAVSVGLFMIMLDNTVVNVALPSIKASLGLSLSELEWVVAGYALTFAAFMLTGGKLADLLGRRFIFMAGLVIFTGASLACGLAPNGGFLIGARVVQGLGGAMMNPATLSIITATFPARQRGTAIGIWAGVSAMALAIGPLVGGVLTEHVNWNWIFFINVPIGIAALLTVPFLIEESRDTSREQRPDVPGLVTSAIGLFALTFAFIEANSYGWTSSQILGAFAVAAVSLAAFVVLELRQRLPMLDLSSVPQPHLQRRERGDAVRRSSDVRDVLLRLALHAERSRLHARADRSVVPADDRADHPDRAAGRAPLRPLRLALAGRRRDDAARDHALLLLDASVPTRASGPFCRACCIGGIGMALDDDADDGRGDERGPGRQGGRRLGRAELDAPGRRLARDRGHGRDRRLGRRFGHAPAARRRTLSCTASTTRCVSPGCWRSPARWSRRSRSARSSTGARPRRSPRPPP